MFKHRVRHSVVYIVSLSDVPLSPFSAFLVLSLCLNGTLGLNVVMQTVCLRLSLKLSASSTHSQQIDIKLRCRSKKESFLFTFEDHDGSVCWL